MPPLEGGRYLDEAEPIHITDPFFSADFYMFLLVLTAY
jgi:hypothetical protein